MATRKPKTELTEPDDLSEYRRHLQAAEQKSQEDFDKTVLSLSGGALGISFVFLKDVIGPNPVANPELLFSSWVAWGMSMFCVLASYYASHLALRRAIRQVDQGTIRIEKAGGMYRTITAVLNALGAVLFLAGVISITLFANANLKSKGIDHVVSKASASATATARATSATPARAASPATALPGS